jgi:uracil-DNA glycosylase
MSINANLVYGKGFPRGIMFIGDAPGQVEESKGEPFVGPSGRRLREALKIMALNFRYYVTTLVKCRSCEHRTDNTGEPIFKINPRTHEEYPDIRDAPVLPNQIDACLPFLYKEIYIVDPVLIVALGSEVAKTLAKIRTIKVLGDPDTKVREIEVPGLGSVPDVTAKKKVWARKVHGELMTPTQTRQLKYWMLPTVSPAHVIRRQADRSTGNPLSVFIKDLNFAIKVFDKYSCQFGAHPADIVISEDDLVGDTYEE